MNISQYLIISIQFLNQTKPCYQTSDNQATSGWSVTVQSILVMKLQSCIRSAPVTWARNIKKPPTRQIYGSHIKSSLKF